MPQMHGVVVTRQNTAQVWSPNWADTSNNRVNIQATDQNGPPAGFIDNTAVYSIQGIFVPTGGTFLNNAAHFNAALSDVADNYYFFS